MDGRMETKYAANASLAAATPEEGRAAARQMGHVAGPPRRDRFFAARQFA